mmetsp:Transcript_2166/g.2944  ORF Transcript_2166/g.2944 Transcript_2166/m.2944 type:complete len:393 (+) Transcript_2166:159-1337(+)
MELRRAEKDLNDLVASYIDLLHKLKRQPHLKDHPDVIELTKIVEVEQAIDGNEECDSLHDQSIVQIHECLTNVLGKIQLAVDVDGCNNKLLEKFRRRCEEKDPVTGKPRYGEKTMQRVKSLLKTYGQLAIAKGFIETGKVVASDASDSLFLQLLDDVKTKLVLSDSGKTIVGLVTELANEEKTKVQYEMESKNKVVEEERKKMEEMAEAEVEKMKQENERAMKEEKDRLAREERERRARVVKDEMEKRIKEEEERQRLEKEKRIIDAIVRGKDGVQIQLNNLRKSCEGEKGAHRVALRSLHILFSQIIARPEELRFRLIRSNHPQFEEDIGRWYGGRELLIAAGFEVIEIDKITCYVTKEPSLANDFDKWTAWFDGLKNTVAAIEKDMDLKS